MIYILFWDSHFGARRNEFKTVDEVLKFIDKEQPRQYNLYLGKRVKLKISTEDEKNEI